MNLLCAVFADALVESSQVGDTGAAGGRGQEFAEDCSVFDGLGGALAGVGTLWKILESVREYKDKSGQSRATAQAGVIRACLPLRARLYGTGYTAVSVGGLKIRFVSLTGR